MDMIFSVMHVQQKFLEEQIPLYQVSIDLTKVFDRCGCVLRCCVVCMFMERLLLVSCQI